MTSLAGRHIVITGASSGIGLATAKAVASLGAKTVLIARSKDALDNAATAIKATGGTALAAVADVCDKTALLAAFDQAEAAFGPVDGLFANAGISGPIVSFTDYDDAAFDAVMTTNVKSTWWAMQRVLPGMITRKQGSIVATGSIASERGLAMSAAYNVSKHAILGLVRSASAEVARHGVRVNCLVPGPTGTRMLHAIATDLARGDTQKGLDHMAHLVPQGRVGTSEEMANVVSFLLSDAASYVNGQAWVVDGGLLSGVAKGG